MLFDGPQLVIAMSRNDARGMAWMAMVVMALICCVVPRGSAAVLIPADQLTMRALFREWGPISPQERPWDPDPRNACKWFGVTCKSDISNITGDPDVVFALQYAKRRLAS